MNHVAYCGLIALLAGASALQLEANPLVVSWVLFVCTIALGVWGGVLAYRSLHASPRPGQGPLQGAPSLPLNSQSDNEGAEQASFVAKVSHELRTPLHNISGLIRVLFLHSKDSTARYYLSMMQDATESLLRTINEVLDFSKANTGQLTVRATDVDIRDIARRALRTVAPRAYEKSELEFFASVDPQVPALLRGDEDRIHQILVNLLGNSIKFTERGFIKLSVELCRGDDSSEMIKFSVVDTGAGIPESKIQSVFEPFQQVDMTVVRKTQGTGLGLTIVKQLVELQGGDVGVESEYKKGSTFWFTIPCTKATAPSQRLAEADGETGNRARLAGARVHIVGARDNLFHELSSAFTRAGATVSNGQRFSSLLDAVSADPTHVVIRESALQGDATWRTLKHFIEDNGVSSVAILLSPTAIEARARATNEGFSNLLALPVLAEDVCDALLGLYMDELGSTREIERLKSVTEPLNILIADDIPVNQFILKSVLEEAGHRVRAVSDGGALLQLIEAQVRAPQLENQSEIFDVILTDIQMPVLDGLSVIRKTRAIENEMSARPLPLIAVTAHAFDEERERIAEAGADGMVTKPLDPIELQRILSSVVRRSTVPSLFHKGDTAKGSRGSEDFSFIDECEVLVDSDKLGVLDLRSVFERSNRSARRTLLILRSFIEGAPYLIEDFDSLSDGGDAGAIERVTHSLKGVLAEVGAVSAAKHAAVVERAAKQGDVSEVAGVMRTLSREAKEVLSIAQTIVGSFSKTGERKESSQELQKSPVL